MATAETRKLFSRLETLTCCHYGSLNAAKKAAKEAIDISGLSFGIVCLINGEYTIERSNAMEVRREK